MTVRKWLVLSLVVSGVASVVSWKMLLRAPLTIAVTSDGSSVITEPAANKLWGKLSQRERIRGASIDVQRPHFPPPVENAASFFIDSSYFGGKDLYPISGIENYAVVLHAAHGYEEYFHVRGEQPVWIAEELSLGDADLRYLWMLSCNVLAHGPWHEGEYPFPGRFEGITKFPGRFEGITKCEAEPTLERNAFCRWGSPRRPGKKIPLGADFRMLCGGATSIALDVDSLWSNLVHREYDLADSFVLAFSKRNSGPKTVPEVAACMTRGGEEADKTPLYDTFFTSEENENGDKGYLFYQYPVFEALGPQSHEPAGDFDFTALPVLKLNLSPGEELLNSLPGFNIGAQTLNENGFLVGDFAGWKVKLSPRSGSLHFIVSDENAGGETRTQLPPFSNLLKNFGPMGRTLQDGDTTQLWIQRATQKKAGVNDDIKNELKHIETSRRYFVQVPGVADPVPVIGDGGRVTTMSSEGGEEHTSHMAFLARSVVGPISDEDEARLISREGTILDAAEEELRRRGHEDYGSVNSTWGYLEAPADCEQTEMGIVFRFRFKFEIRSKPIEVVDIRIHTTADWDCVPFGAS